MILPSPIRRLIRIFRGDVSAVLILLSVALGFTFGVTPGFYGLHVALLVIALILNINVGIFILFAAAGRALCFAAAPVMFHAGRWVQETLPGLLNLLAAIPFIGLTDFSRYSVAGGVLIGPVLGVIGGVLLAAMVMRFRRAWLSMEANSEKFRAWHSRRSVRFAERILVGKRADPAEVLKRRARFFRIPGIVAAAAVVILFFVGLQFLQESIVTEFTARSMTSANGAQADVAGVSLQPLGGRFSLRGLQLTDPAAPERNRFAVREARAAVSLWNLSVGRIVMDEVAVEDVRFDQPRDRRGHVVPEEPPQPSEPFDLSRFKVSEADLAKLETYVQDARALHEWLEKVRPWLPEPKKRPPPPPIPQRYLEYLSACAPQSPTPRVLVRQVSLTGVELPIEEFGRSEIRCLNISDAPSAAGLPVTIEIKSQSRPNTMRIVSHYEHDDPATEFVVEFADVDLKNVQSRLNSGNAVKFAGGAASGSLKGIASRKSMDLALHVKTRGLRAETGGKGVFGLDPEVTREALKLIENLETTLRLVGPIEEPRLVFDGPGLTKEFRDALVRAGKTELARRANQLLGDKLPGGVPDVDTVAQDPLKAGLGLAGALTSRPADKDDSKKKESERRPRLRRP